MLNGVFVSTELLSCKAPVFSQLDSCLIETLTIRQATVQPNESWRHRSLPTDGHGDSKHNWIILHQRFDRVSWPVVRVTTTKNSFAPLRQCLRLTRKAQISNNTCAVDTNNLLANSGGHREEFQRTRTSWITSAALLMYFSYGRWYWAPNN